MAFHGICYSTLLIPIFIVVWVQYAMAVHEKLQEGGRFDAQDTFVLGALGLYILWGTYRFAQDCGVL